MALSKAKPNYQKPRKKIWKKLKAINRNQDQVSHNQFSSVLQIYNWIQKNKKTLFIHGTI